MLEPIEWMPFNVRKYLGKTMGLTRDEHGAYFLLLLAYWMRGGPLVDNDNELAAIAKATRQEWKRLRPRLAQFFEIKDGQWIQEKAEKELVKAREMIAAKSKAGKCAADKRWEDHRKTNSERNASGITDASQTDKHTDAPLPKPLPISEAKASSIKRGSVLPANFPSQDSDLVTDAMNYWREKEREDLVEDWRDQIAQFRDHHLKEGTISKDWDASWRTWMRNALKFNRKPKQNGQNTERKQGATADQHLVGLGDLANELREGRR